MGTRALTRVFDGRIQLLCIYTQYDGYPSGLGREIASLLVKGTVVNGISGDRHCFNGAGDLAAQLVCHLKQGAATRPLIGLHYIMPNHTNEAGQDFEYWVKVGEPGTPVVIEVRSYHGNVLFAGTPETFAAFCEEDES